MSVGSIVVKLILTLIVLLVMYLLGNWVNGAPFADANIKWCLVGVVILLGVVLILSIWGILGGGMVLSSLPLMLA